MSIDPLAFLDEPQTSGSSKGQNDPLSFLDEPKSSGIRLPGIGIGKKNASENKVPSMKRQASRDAITSGTAMAGLPGDLASIFTGDNPVTSKSLREKAFELSPSLSPQTEQEKSWDEGLSTLMGFATPGGPFKAAGKLVGKGASKLVPKALRGQYKELYEIGKQIGIDEKALAPFRHGRVTGSFLKAMSKLGDTAKKGVEFAEKLATPMYDKLYEQGAKIPVNEISKRGVVRGLEGIIKQIQKSPAIVKESKDVVNFLEEAIHGLKNNPNLNVENLMALQKQIGKTVNWNSIKQAGKGRLANEARDAVMTGIYGMNPRLGQKFANMDKVYGGFRRLSKEVTPSKMVEFASKGGPLGYLAISVLTGKDFGDTATKAAELYFGKKGIEKISGKLLTDPRWVGIKEKFIKIIKEESFDKLPKFFVALKKKLDMDKEDSKYDFD